MKVKNYWKNSFFVLLVIFLVTMAILTYFTISMGISNSHQRKGYYATEKDLIIFKNASIGKVKREDIIRSLKASSEDISLENNMKGDHLLLYRTTIFFDKNNLIKRYGDWGSEE